ncbi:MAG TPA: tRNA-dihydrouridine synthase family protein [Chitinivibrionales bacterium]|nr:tRNA-dihydrouridine synthase family protein [Chitinivibrionales bacterium]
MILSPLLIKQLVVSPPLFCAPMAGVSHCAFRRLVAGFGGYGALFTEMLSGRAVLHEKAGESPFTKRRPEEETVWYQLALNGREDIASIVERMAAVSPAALDLNAGCPAPEMERQGTGVSLYADAARFERVLKTLRSCWGGPLTVKCRLWKSETDWKPEFRKRLRIIEDCGADALFVHPRFFKEKLKRRARWEFFEWICEQTKLPVIANGDIGFVEDIERNADAFAAVKGLMIGRQAIVRPWIFREFPIQGTGTSATPVDYAGVFRQFCDYVNEDFPPEKAIGRLKEFMKYYACNFFFGHRLRTAAQNAQTVGELVDTVMRFLLENPRVVDRPSVAGL